MQNGNSLSPVWWKEGWKIARDVRAQGERKRIGLSTLMLGGGRTMIIAKGRERYVVATPGVTEDGSDELAILREQLL